MNGRISVVIGPPCAGKSTYVKKVRLPGEVVVDYDEIARALGSVVPHQCTGGIREVAFAVRDAAIRRVLQGLKVQAYIIHTAPRQASVMLYKHKKAEFILIDPGIDVCLERAKEREKETAEIIRKWYASPPAVIAEMNLTATDSSQAKIQATQKVHETLQSALFRCI
jgi:predicted kinase